MEEKVFFENGNIKVTNARFVVDNKTYAIAAVNSLKVSSDDITPSNTPPGILIAVGVVWFIGAISNYGGFLQIFLPVLVTAFGCYWFRSIKKKVEYKIMLTTSSGEADALTSTNDQEILAVEKALHEAIISRG